jgi:hypothetical protein
MREGGGARGQLTRFLFDVSEQKIVCLKYYILDTTIYFDTEVEVQMTKRVREAKERSGNSGAKRGHGRT